MVDDRSAAEWSWSGLVPLESRRVGRKLRIGELAHAVGVPGETIRFYEREGILPLPPRTESGHRRYPEEAIEWIRFVRRARELGFSVDEAGRLLRLLLEGRGTCAPAHVIIAERVAELDREAAEIERSANALRAMLALCSGDEPAAQCEALAGIGHDLGR